LDRDLARVDLWEESLRRSRRRRELTAARGPELPGKEISLVALVALAGVPATGVAAAKVLGGGGESADTAAAAAKPAVALEPAATAKPRQRDARRQFADVPARTRPASERPAVARSSDATVPRPAVRKVAAREPAGILQLQRALAVPVDGDFGLRTARALERWQRAHGIAADGVAGPQTREALGLGPGRVLRRRERPAKRRHVRRSHRAVPVRATAARHGGGVRGLQRALGLGADGVFGPATEKALERWQRAHGLTADGVAGPQTRRKLGMAQGPALKRRGGRRRRRHSGGGGGSSGGGGGSSTGGGGSSTVQRVIAAANRIASRPYVYGGGHGSFDAPGYDCSGSVSYALHGGGLLSAPLDSSGFMSYGAPGAGRHITIYANPGHVYMTIDGRRFDTSARSQTGSRWSGSGRGGGGYTVRHPSGL